MANSWNQPDDITKRLKFLGDEITYDLEPYLVDANKRVKRVFGKHVEEQLISSYDGQRSFKLVFPDVHRIVRVQLNDELVSSDDYTFFNSEDADDEEVIEFTEEFYNSKMKKKKFLLFVDYIPEDFVDLELQYAIEQILTWTSIQNNDDTEDTRLKNCRDRISELKKEITNLLPNPNEHRGLKPVHGGRYLV